MKMHNNYILLLKESSSKKSSQVFNEDNNTIIIDIPVDLRELLNSVFNLDPMDWKEKSKYFWYVVSFQLPMNDLKINISFEVFDVHGNRYLNIESHGSTSHQCAKALDIINTKLFDIKNKIEEQYIIISTYDAVSEFYCNKIFSKFANFERSFRRLLFNIYILNYGRQYYEKTICKQIANKAKGTIRAKRHKDEQYLKEFFYSLDYSDLQAILFTQNWTSVDEEEISKFLEYHDNLSLISDEELRKFIQNIGAKSDWERLFKDKVSLISIEEDIDYVRRQRNKVAHSKNFTYEDYKESLKILNKLIKAVDDAIELTQDKVFLEKNIDDIKISVQKVTESIRQFSKIMEESFSPIKQIPMIISDVLREAMEPIYESNRNYASILKKNNYKNFGDKDLNYNFKNEIDTEDD